ncbi:MAG TPA: myxococcus cysteine-rich repeat containing protein [Candidatus Binatia bacterium]|nr:myxococcus cysteine-rich repeat containing protein [Candidatus Binatia bacterium]
MRKSIVLASSLVLLLTTAASAEVLTRSREAHDVDWVSTGVSGIEADEATINLTGVNGTVKKAWLYWNGIAVGLISDHYDAGDITFAGAPVSGTPRGDSSTNCWGDGTSRTYFADVTALVTGNGSYLVTGLQPEANYHPNGVSLVVTFDDGNPANDVDLVIFEGNDSNSGDETSETESEGWHLQMPNIVYSGGTVRMQFHLADGQSFDDGDLLLRGPAGDLTISDTVGLWDGDSLAPAGVGRAPDGFLWDINTIDISSMFRLPGPYRLFLDGQQRLEDCVALAVLIIELGGNESGACGDGTLKAPEQCDDGNTVDGDCCSSTCTFEPVGSPCGTPGDPCLEARCDGEGLCDDEGRSCHAPIGPRASRLRLRHGLLDRFDWKWGTGVSTVDDFGNPGSMPGYDLCVYDKGTGSLRLLGRASVDPDASWQATGGGYAYRSAGGPVQELILQGGRPGTAKITARGGGAGFELPPMPVAPPVIVRLRARGGQCWGANFTTPAKNTRRRFQSRSDFFHER